MVSRPWVPAIMHLALGFWRLTARIHNRQNRLNLSLHVDGDCHGAITRILVPSAGCQVLSASQKIPPSQSRTFEHSAGAAGALSTRT